MLLKTLLLPLAFIASGQAAAVTKTQSDYAVIPRAGEVTNSTDWKPLSNAERMKRGLTPNKPARRYDPSRTRALAPRASDPISNIYIAVYNSQTNVFIGYTYYKTSYMDGVTTDIGSADYYTLPNSGPSTQNSISAHLSSYDITGYPGMNGYSGDGYLPPSSLYLGGYTTLAGSADEYSIPNCYVFNIPSVPGLMTVTWVQPDNTLVTPNSYYDSTNDILKWAASASDADLADSDQVWMQWIQVPT